MGSDRSGTDPQEARVTPGPRSVDRNANRRKDPDIDEMAESLEHFETVLLRYTAALESELEDVKRHDRPIEKLVTGLEGMIEMLKTFHRFIDEEVWDRMIAVADRSTSHVHRRTGRFF